MKRLDSIPVTVVPALPLLHELAAMLDKLIESGETDSIDLRREPLSPQDRARLKEILGQGELSARVDSLGPTTIQETAIAGVWWLTHCDAEDRVLGEFIEVTTCPELLRSSIPEVRSGVSRLRARLAEQTAPKDPGALDQRVRALGFEPAQSQQKSPRPDQQSK